MNEPTDQQLLREYALEGREAAFTELVRRHIDFVYSAALRMVRDAHLAKDVTQGVFMALAHKASTLLEGPAVESWLHGTTRNLAANVVRTDVRRRAREQEAAIMNDSSSTDASWEQVAVHLDAVLGELTESDREAVLLRYFKNYDLRTIGAVLGISDDAAQKRVSCAIERLRECLAGRGVVVGATGLAALIFANSVQAAPVGLAVSISASTSLTGTVLCVTAGKTITMTTLQKLIISTAIIAGLATSVVIQHQAQSRLRQENQSLRQQLELAERATENVSARDAQNILPNNQLNELLGLRNEVGMLRRQTNELAALEEENRRLRSGIRSSGDTSDASSPPDAPAEDIFPRSSWAFKGFENPKSALQSVMWSYGTGNRSAFLGCLSPEALRLEQERMTERMQQEGKSELEITSEIVAENADEFRNVTGFRVVEERTTPEDPVVSIRFYAEGAGWQERVKLRQINNEWKLDAMH